MAEIRVGTVVQLRSGGPKMTVSSISKQSPGTIYCVWFLDGVPQKSDFPAEALDVVASQG